MESSSIKDGQRKIESETIELQNDLKPQLEIVKTEEDIKIKLEPNDGEDSKNEIREIIWLDSNLIVKQEFEENPEIVNTESFDNMKELDAELENGLNEKDKMDFTDASCLSNPRDIKKTVRKRKKSYQCTLCESNFSRKSDLKKHIESDHAGLKPHKCPSCESSFSQKSNLKRHIAFVHKGIRPKSDLKHIGQVHEGIKPFNCGMCVSSFSQKSGLKEHIASVHEGKKPHKCPRCESSFSEKSHLKRHIASCVSRLNGKWENGIFISPF